jgi:hypothetical protein
MKSITVGGGQAQCGSQMMQRERAVAANLLLHCQNTQISCGPPYFCHAYCMTHGMFSKLHNLLKDRIKNSSRSDKESAQQ